MKNSIKRTQESKCKKKRRKKLRSALIKGLPVIGIIIFALLIKKTGINEISAVLKNTNPLHFIPVLFIQPLIFLLQTQKWHALLKEQNIIVPLTKLYRMHWASFYLGIITPGRAGELLKIHMLQRLSGHNAASCSVSVILDRMLSFVHMAVIVTFGNVYILFLLGRSWLNGAFFMWGLAATTASICLLCILYPSIFRRLLNLFKKRLIPPGIQKKLIIPMVNSWRSRPAGMKLIKPFLLGLVSLELYYIQMIIISRIVGMEISPFALNALAPIATLAALLPVAPGGLGVREFTLIGLLSLFQVPPEKTMALSVLLLFFCNLLPGIGGFIAAHGPGGFPSDFRSIFPEKIVTEH